MDTATIRESAPDVSTSETRPHACMNSVVYIGHLVEVHGEEGEVVKAVPCRRYAATGDAR